MECKKLIEYLMVVSLASSTSSTIADQQKEEVAGFVLTGSSLATALLALILSYIDRQSKQNKDLHSSLNEDELKFYEAMKSSRDEKFVNAMLDLKAYDEEIVKLSSDKTLVEIKLERFDILQKLILFLSSLTAVLSSASAEETEGQEEAQITTTSFFTCLSYVIYNIIEKEKTKLSNLEEELDESYESRAQLIGKLMQEAIGFKAKEELLENKMQEAIGFKAKEELLESNKKVLDSISFIFAKDPQTNPISDNDSLSVELSEVKLNTNSAEELV